ncbi:unnamed protein product [Psylliodes chrysocephalus]|uniref:Uncharacterized protein n=1 Tax=Psylliodes chrysocephalus TaxID=3402493 RepID=A0A9P0C7P0_9CUCU|nr:unnamed protein product [Psylliodes chrysocephala]
MGEKIAPSKENSDNQGKIMNEMLTGATENPTGEENMDANSESNDNNTNDEPNEEEDNSGDMSPEEFAALDNQLDVLNSALDDIEQKNDNIHAQLLQLLEANREVRQQLQQANNDKNRSNENQVNEPNK